MVDDSSSTPCLPLEPLDPLDGLSVINDTLTVQTIEQEGNLLMPSAVAAASPPESLQLPSSSTAANNITPAQGGAITAATIRTRPVIAPQDIIDFPSMLRAISKKKRKQTQLNKKKKRMKSANQVDLTEYGMGVMGSTESVSRAEGDTSTVCKEASKQEAYLQHLQSMRVEQIQQQQAASKEEEVN